MMMNKEPTRIINVLDFLSKQLDKFVNNKENEEEYKKTKELLGIENIVEENKIMMFYNVKCKVLDDKSLLDYIDSQNVRFSRQREELIELSVKIASLNQTRKNDKDKGVVDTEKAMDEVINHYKSGLSSGVGLRDMLIMIKERYPWTPFLKKIMILVSLMCCLLNIGLFVLDLYTDINFSLYMLEVNETTRRISSKENNSDDFLEKHYDNFNSLRSANSEVFYNLSFLYKRNKIWNVLEEEEDYLWTGRLALWHCIQPFGVTMIVFIIINYKKVKCSVPEFPDAPPEVPVCIAKNSFCRVLNKSFCSIPFTMLWPLGYLLVKCLASFFLVVSSVVPIPAFTNIYRFYLRCKFHNTRSDPKFKEKIGEYEQKLKNYEAIGKL